MIKLLNLIFFVSSVTFAAETKSVRNSADLNVGLGLIYPFDKTQDISGSEESDPMTPTVTLNGTWNIYRSISFSPILGYSHYKNTTNDSYGGDYSMESFYVLYDFIMPMFNVNNLDFRYGFGAIQKRINGSGGYAVIPNGNTTAMGFRPTSSKPTSTLTFNVGVDYRLNLKGTTIKDQGVRFEIFVLQPLDKTKRMLSSSLIYNLFF